MNILVTDSVLLPKVLNTFPKECLISKRVSPITMYDFEINHIKVSIIFDPNVNDNTIRGRSFNLVYTTPAHYNSHSQVMMGIFMTNPDAQINLSFGTDDPIPY